MKLATLLAVLISENGVVKAGVVNGVVNGVHTIAAGT